MTMIIIKNILLDVINNVNNKKNNSDDDDDTIAIKEFNKVLFFNVVVVEVVKNRPKSTFKFRCIIKGSGLLCQFDFIRLSKHGVGYNNKKEVFF